MPRESTISESAKRRSLRVPLDHYAQSGCIAPHEAALVGYRGLCGLAYAAWLMVGGRSEQQHASPGPVAAVHAAWNDDCQACHRDFQPLRSDAVSLVGLSRGLSSSSIARRSVHQMSQHAGASCGCQGEGSAELCKLPSRTSGQAADIVRPADGSCLGCHRDLEQHRNGASGLTPAVANVWGFGLGGKDKSERGRIRSFVR